MPEVPGPHLSANRQCRLGFVLHASSAGFAAESAEGALSVKSMWGGRAHYRLGKARLLVDDDAYAILNEGRPYVVEVEPEVESFCLFFAPAVVSGALQARSQPLAHLLELPEPTPGGGFFERRYEHDDIVSPVLARLRAGNLEDRWSADEWDDHLLLALERLFQRQDGVRREVEGVAAARASTREELYRRLHRARDYLEASLSEPVDLEGVAAVAHLSPFHFHRSFKRLFGETPARFVNRRRIERAEQLLRSTELTTLEVCQSVGFESLGSFTSLFRQRTGSTPGAYRRLAARRK